MTRGANALAAAALLLQAACGSEATVAPDVTADLPPTTTSATTPSRPQESVTSSTTPTTVPLPTAGTSADSGRALAEILEPYETRALAETMFTSYRFSCWPYTGPQGPVWLDWQGEEVDRDQPMSRGAVLSCLPRTDPPADSGSMDLIVLDDTGTITWWWVGSDAVSHVPAAPGGLLCREYMATASFNDAMEWVGASPPWNDDVLAYQWVLAYWFLDGQPGRMDVDGDGVPCELLFDQEVVTEVWAGDNPTP
jgi:hypothetical protein